MLLVLDLGGRSGGSRSGIAGTKLGGNSAIELFGVSLLGLGGREGGVEYALSLSILSGDTIPLVCGDMRLVGDEGPLLPVLSLCVLRVSTDRVPSSGWPSTKTCDTPGWWDFRRPPTIVLSQPCFNSGDRRSHLNFRGWGEAETRVRVMTFKMVIALQSDILVDGVYSRVCTSVPVYL